jgi:serine/threonine protein kinase
VKFGERLPGWTPSWSAPEQVRGEPVTGAADVYPLALMAARILGGEVVGEVRKYRTPAALQMPEVDLFHNPSLYIDRDKRLVSSDGIRAWRDLVERSLSFDPERRPASASDFADEMRALFDAYPIADTVTLSPTGDLVASRLVDGSEAVAHLVSVDQPSPSGQPSYGPPASYGQPASYGGFVPPFSPTGTDYPTYTG